MNTSDRQTQFAIAISFFVPGALYASMTARLPALATQANLAIDDVATMLFCIGCVCLFALFLSPHVIQRWGSKLTLIILLPFCVLSMVAMGFATEHWMVYACVTVLAFTMGISDVASNTQAMMFETSTRRPVMSLFHAFYSIGVILASVSASLFAYWNVPLTINFLVASLTIGVLFFLVSSSLIGVDQPNDAPNTRVGIKEPRNRSAMVTLYLIGVMALLMYCAEGIISDWGSLFMKEVKCADESLAALAYGVFCSMTVPVRLVGDRLRAKMGNLSLLKNSTFFATLGMGITFLSTSPWITLVGYAVTGLGLALTVPILFSMAGQIPGVHPEIASARVGICAYAGLLFFPPCIGFISHAYGLEKALLIVFPILAIFFLGYLWLRKRTCVYRSV